ncbi:rhodanese-like domain-containing protein [Kitasatospora sp. NPDC004669]|uniref:rhodanese-like domain-containing protein n=1 Tax=Kitasatospora sp. NPDC004669 TaxID=3154555 RepID=UPI0033A23BB0
MTQNGAKARLHDAFATSGKAPANGRRLELLDLLAQGERTVDALADRLEELPADTEVVVYCRGEYCVLAYDAVRLLAARGRRAIRLNDGMLEWRLAELPVAEGAFT